MVLMSATGAETVASSETAALFSVAAFLAPAAAPKKRGIFERAGAPRSVDVGGSIESHAMFSITIALFKVAICHVPFAGAISGQHAGAQDELLEAQLDLFWRFSLEVVTDEVRERRETQAPVSDHGGPMQN